MKLRISATISVVLIFVAVRSFASDPGADLCDGFDSSARADEATRAIAFHQRLDPTGSFILQERDSDCVVAALDPLSEKVRSYCAARAEVGHSLAVHELTMLSTHLNSLALDCSRERDRRREEQLGPMVPETCGDLANSFLSMVQFLTDEGEAPVSLLVCARTNVAVVAAELAEKCHSGELSLRASAVELAERISLICPASE